MTEYLSNGIQLLATGFCSTLGFVRSRKSGLREWALLGLFSGAYFLGDLYWMLFYLFYGETPFYSFIPDLSWQAAMLFLLLLMLRMREPLPSGRTALIAWAGPVFAAGMCVFFMMWGEYLSNLAYAVLMALILWYSIDGLVRDKGGRFRSIYLLTVFFCLCLYTMWVFSCYWMGETLANPYYWFDLMVSGCFVAGPFLLRKAVEG